MFRRLLQNHLVVKVLLRILHNVHHHLERFQRIFPLRRLAGEHHGIGAVIYRVRNVGHLRSCRARVADHGVQHLRGGDDRFIIIIAFLYKHLLQIRYFLSRYLHTEIAAGYHNTVRTPYDLFNIFDPLGIFDLGDDRDIRRTALFEPCPDLQDAFRISYK